MSKPSTLVTPPRPTCRVVPSSPHPLPSPVHLEVARRTLIVVGRGVAAMFDSWGDPGPCERTYNGGSKWDEWS